MGSNCCKADSGQAYKGSSIYTRSRAGASLDERFTVSEGAGGVRLTVAAARAGDSGVYTLQASNAAGRDTARVRLDVALEESGHDPPIFQRRLQDLTVKVGTRTRLFVEILSTTDCKVTWYRNERRLLEAERVSLARDGNFWWCDVACVSVDDAGRWTCAAENSGGRASCAAHLNVLVPKAYKRPEFVEELRAILTEQGTVSLECKVVGVPTPVLRWFKDSREIKAGDVFALTASAEDPTSLGTYTCEAVNCMGRAYSSSKVHVTRGRDESRPSSAVTPEPPPIFTKELEDQFVKICEHLTLGCHIVVPPWPRSVVWYNKEGKVEPGERYHVTEDGVGGYLLEVQAAEWPDEGEWKCVATSAGGRVGISTCHVIMDVPKNYRKPRFMENLQAVLTEEGLVSFECKVVGFPTPALSWFKDGQELKPGDVYQLTGTNSLGSYCCIARNCMGQASSSAELTVEDIQNQLNEEEKLQLFSKNQAPKFVQGLKSVEAKIDEPFRFTIRVAIPPEPSVLWYRDDQPVDESPRCHLAKEDRGMFSLDIQNLEFLDQAEWKCVAMNDFGHSVTSCFLKLIIPRHYKKPRFLENLQAILSEEGAVNLECKVIGVPQPVLKWYKDGEELKPGDIHRIISGQDGTCCLGTYTCEAQNCMGIAASSASLLGFDDSMKAKKKIADEQALQRNLSLSTIHEERTSQMYDTPVGDITLDDKGEISFSFDGKEVSVSLYETPDLTEEEALQIVEMYADQLSENVTEHNVVELPPLRFVKETSTSGNLLMEAIIIDVSPEYFASPEEDLRTEADIEDISIADENGPPQLSLDTDLGEDYLEKTMALLSDEKSDIPKRTTRKKSDSLRSGEDFFSLSREQSISEDKKDDDTQIISESDLASFASARSYGKLKSKSSRRSIEDGRESSETKTILHKVDVEEVKELKSETKEIRTEEKEMKTDEKESEQKRAETETPVMKPKRERRSSRSSRRSSSGSEKSYSKSREEQLQVKAEIELKPKMTDDEFKTKVTDVSSVISKAINDVQIIERDIILKSELMSSAATASKSLEIINSLITPLSEILSIAEAAKESIQAIEIGSIFNNLPQSMKALQQSLTIVEKCIDLEGENKTLVKKTCVAFIEACGNEIQRVMSDISAVTMSDYLQADESVIKEIQNLTKDMTNVIKYSSDTIKTRNLLNEASEIKSEETSVDTKHLKDTQKAVFELRSPLNSLLCIAESADSGKIIDFTKIKNSEVILHDMSASVQDLQAALEQIESLSVKESTTSLNRYNTEIIETVMDSVLKLRISFEQLSKETKSEDDKAVLKQALTSIKQNLSEISTHIDKIENNIGKFDILQSDNKLEVLQKMAQILIALENNLPRLETLPEVKLHLDAFHKNLTKVLENVIETNEAKKYFSLIEICDVVNRVNAAIKTIDSDSILSLASLNNTLRIVQDHFVSNVFDSELNCAILNNIADVLVDIQEAINQAEEVSLHIDSEHVVTQDVSSYETGKANIALERIEHTIAAINKVKALECTKELKEAITHVLENVCPILEDLKRSVASIAAGCVVQDENISDMSDVQSVAQTLATPLCELNQNIMVINQTIVEHIESLKENSEVFVTVAEPLHELHTTLETLQQVVISQYGEDLTPYEVNVNMANAVQNLQSCILMIREQGGIEIADEMSTLEDISGIKTTADTLPSDRLVLPEAAETTAEQAVSSLHQDVVPSATAQALQSLNDHITILQNPDVIDALDTLSEVSDYSSLKSVVLGLGELHSGIQEILHPFILETSDEIAHLNTSVLMAIAEPMQDLQQCLSVLDANNIPIYEHILEMPTDKIHAVFQSITEFKETLDKCIHAVFPAMETADKTIEISNKVESLRAVCEHLKDIIENTKTISAEIPVKQEVIALEETVNNLLDATDVSKGIRIEQLKSVTQELYENVINVQEELIQFTPQAPEKLAQEAKLIQIIDKVERNIAVLEEYDFVDLSRASDMSCASPQVALYLDTDALIEMDDVVQCAVGIIQDSSDETPVADLMIVEDFFKNCKNEFALLRCLLTKKLSHKKIIRLLQEFNALKQTINDFKVKQTELCLAEDISNSLKAFFCYCDECLSSVQESLLKIVDSQSDLLFKAPIQKLEITKEVLSEILTTSKFTPLEDVAQRFVNVIEIAKPCLQRAETVIHEEIINNSTVVEDKPLLDAMDDAETFIEEQILTKSELTVESREILQKVLNCIQKHHDYKDAIGTGKTLILLKCLAECSDILQEHMAESKLEIKEHRFEDTALKVVLAEMLAPLQALHHQLLNIQDQVLTGVEDDITSVDLTSTESFVQAMGEIQQDIKQLEQHVSEGTIVDSKEKTMIMELDKEIHTIQDSIKLIENVTSEDKEKFTKPMEEIEKSLKTLLATECKAVAKGETPELVQNVEKCIELIQILEEISTIIKIDNIAESANIARELRESVTVSQIVTEDGPKEINEESIETSKRQANLAMQLKDALTSIQTQVIESTKDLEPELRNQVVMRIEQSAEQLQNFVDITKTKIEEPKLVQASDESVTPRAEEESKFKIEPQVSEKQETDAVIVSEEQELEKTRENLESFVEQVAIDIKAHQIEEMTTSKITTEVAEAAKEVTEVLQLESETKEAQLMGAAEGIKPVPVIGETFEIITTEQLSTVETCVSIIVEGKTDETDVTEAEKTKSIKEVEEAAAIIKEQKEISPAIELVQRIDEYLSQDLEKTDVTGDINEITQIIDVANELRKKLTVGETREQIGLITGLQVLVTQHIENVSNLKTEGIENLANATIRLCESFDNVINACQMVVGKEVKQENIVNIKKEDVEGYRPIDENVVQDIPRLSVEETNITEKSSIETILVKSEKDNQNREDGKDQTTGAKVVSIDIEEKSHKDEKEITEISKPEDITAETQSIQETVAAKPESKVVTEADTTIVSLSESDIVEVIDVTETSHTIQDTSPKECISSAPVDLKEGKLEEPVVVETIVQELPSQKDSMPKESEEATSILSVVKEDILAESSNVESSIDDQHKFNQETVEVKKAKEDNRQELDTHVKTEGIDGVGAVIFTPESVADEKDIAVKTTEIIKVPPDEVQDMGSKEVQEPSQTVNLTEVPVELLSTPDEVKICTEKSLVLPELQVVKATEDIVKELDVASVEESQVLATSIETATLVQQIDELISAPIAETIEVLSKIIDVSELKESIAVANELKDTFTEAEKVRTEDASKEQAMLVEKLQGALEAFQTVAIENTENISQHFDINEWTKVSEVVMHLQDKLAKATVSEPTTEMAGESMHHLETLLQEVTDKIGTTERSSDDTESLRDNLDEIQTVIIKLKRDYDGASNDALNETLEDLECSVRSVQLQITEDSPPELLKEACATLQLLVNNMSATEDITGTVVKEVKTFNLLEKCSDETEETVKLLNMALETKGDMSKIVENLRVLKEVMQVLRNNFLKDADTLIDKGVEVIQSLDQVEEKVFALEKDIVDIPDSVKETILNAVHSVYGSISNMRSTVQSIQKRYMHDNYGKPSEDILKAMKNVNNMYWKNFSKSLRKVLNHFEDIKFYINLDKTARLPSDAAFTKIILNELRLSINETVKPHSENNQEVARAYLAAIKIIDSIMNKIESLTSLEVKQKIPIFKEIATYLLKMTEAIANCSEEEDIISDKIDKFDKLDMETKESVEFELSDEQKAIISTVDPEVLHSSIDEIKITAEDNNQKPVHSVVETTDAPAESKIPVNVKDAAHIDTGTKFAADVEIKEIIEVSKAIISEQEDTTKKDTTTMIGTDEKPQQEDVTVQTKAQVDDPQPSTSKEDNCESEVTVSKDKPEQSKKEESLDMLDISGIIKQDDHKVGTDANKDQQQVSVLEEKDNLPERENDVEISQRKIEPPQKKPGPAEEKLELTKEKPELPLEIPEPVQEKPELIQDIQEIPQEKSEPHQKKTEPSPEKLDLSQEKLEPPPEKTDSRQEKPELAQPKPVAIQERPESIQEIQDHPQKIPEPSQEQPEAAEVKPKPTQDKMEAPEEESQPRLEKSDTALKTSELPQEIQDSTQTKPKASQEELNPPPEKPEPPQQKSEPAQRKPESVQEIPEALQVKSEPPKEESKPSPKEPAQEKPEPAQEISEPSQLISEHTQEKSEALQEKSVVLQDEPGLIQEKPEDSQKQLEPKIPQITGEPLKEKPEERQDQPEQPQDKLEPPYEKSEPSQEKPVTSKKVKSSRPKKDEETQTDEEDEVVKDVSKRIKKLKLKKDHNERAAQQKKGASNEATISQAEKENFMQQYEEEEKEKGLIKEKQEDGMKIMVTQQDLELRAQEEEIKSEPREKMVELKDSAAEIDREDTDIFSTGDQKAISVKSIHEQDEASRLDKVEQIDSKTKETDINHQNVQELKETPTEEFEVKEQVEQEKGASLQEAIHESQLKHGQEAKDAKPKQDHDERDAQLIEEEEMDAKLKSEHEEREVLLKQEQIKQAKLKLEQENKEAKLKKEEEEKAKVKAKQERKEAKLKKIQEDKEAKLRLEQEEKDAKLKLQQEDQEGQLKKEKEETETKTKVGCNEKAAAVEIKETELKAEVKKQETQLTEEEGEKEPLLEKEQVKDVKLKAEPEVKKEETTVHVEKVEKRIDKEQEDRETSLKSENEKAMLRKEQEDKDTKSKVEQDQSESFNKKHEEQDANLIKEQDKESKREKLEKTEEKFKTEEAMKKTEVKVEKDITTLEKEISQKESLQSLQEGDEAKPDLAETEDVSSKKYENEKEDQVEMKSTLKEQLDKKQAENEAQLLTQPNKAEENETGVESNKDDKIETKTKEEDDAKLKKEQADKEVKVKLEEELKEAKLKKEEEEKTKLKAKQERKEAKLKKIQEDKEAKLKKEQEEKDAKLKQEQEEKEAHLKEQDEKESKLKAEQEAKQSKLNKEEAKIQAELDEKTVKLEKEKMEIETKLASDLEKGIQLKKETEEKEKKVAKLKLDQEEEDSLPDKTEVNLKKDQDENNAELNAEHDKKNTALKKEQKENEAKLKAEEESRQAQLKQDQVDNESKHKLEEEIKEAKFKKEQEEEQAKLKAKQEKKEAKLKKIQNDKEAKLKQEQEEKDAVLKAEQNKKDAFLKIDQEENDAKPKAEEELKEAQLKQEQVDNEAKRKNEEEIKEATLRKEQEEEQAKLKLKQEKKEAKLKKIQNDKEAKLKQEQEEKDAMLKAEQDKKDAILKKEQEENDAKLKAEEELREAQLKQEQADNEAKRKLEEEIKEATLRKEQEEEQAKLKLKQEKKEAKLKKIQNDKEAELKQEQEEKDAMLKAEQDKKDAILKKEQEENDAKLKAEEELREAQLKQEQADNEAKRKLEEEIKEATLRKEQEEEQAKLKAKQERKDAKLKKIQKDKEAKLKKEQEEKDAVLEREKNEAELERKQQDQDAKLKGEKELDGKETGEKEAKLVEEKAEQDILVKKEQEEKDVKLKKDAKVKEVVSPKGAEKIDQLSNEKVIDEHSLKENDKKKIGKDADDISDDKSKKGESRRKLSTSRDQEKQTYSEKTRDEGLRKVESDFESRGRRRTSIEKERGDGRIRDTRRENGDMYREKGQRDYEVSSHRDRKVDEWVRSDQQKDDERRRLADHSSKEYTSEAHSHYHRDDEKRRFVDHGSRDYTSEFARPSNYREKTYQSDNFHVDTVGKGITIYKAQTLVLDAELRSSVPPVPRIETSRRSEPTERRTDLKHKTKAVSEARSILSEKRSSMPRDIKRKPVFSTYLTDRTAVEGSRVKLTCSVLSSVDPTITWYKNGVLIDNKFKYRTKYVDGLVTLEVLNAVPADSAEYNCTVDNENGSVSTTATLKVYPSFEASPIPPTFTRSIRDTYHLAENELFLECRIRGQPLPTISWLKDDRPISSNDRYQAYYLADGVCRLAIDHPTPEDSGKYTCKAENSVWSDQITHVVSFTGKDTRLSPNIQTIERSRFTRQAMESRRPHFTNVLTDYKVAKGGTIGLQVEIRGCPTRVEWLREGQSVTDVYRNARTFVEQGLYTLALSDVTEKETGLYTCRAWSTHGNVDMNAAITVVHPAEMGGKPAIIAGRPEKDVLISVGEDLNISFRVQGEPKPKVVFMKGTRDITNSQRVCKMTSDDYVKFTVKRSVISDAGTYCILARNAYGCDRAFVTVVVRQRASSENLISDWTYPLDDSAITVGSRNYDSVPRIPSEPSVVDGGTNWISLAWPKPETTTPVLAYKVESWLLGKEGGARWTELGITPRNSFDIFNLKQGEQYHFRVTLRNRYGWGESVQTSTPIGVGLAGDRPEFVDILPGQLKVLVGATANLSCSVKGKPVPEVVWLRNGHEIEDARMKSSFNGYNCSLVISDIRGDDEARYSCEASNEHGRSSTYARLAVVTDRLVWEADAKLKRERSSDVPGDYPPQFTMRLRDRRVQATYPVRLTCQVVGCPAPTVTWYKDGEEVYKDNRHTHFKDELFHTLEIAPTTLEDGGVYSCEARNGRGAVSCRCSLVVDKGIRAYVAPEFCCGLEPLYRLREGDELRITAVVEAYPSVGVTWYRDGIRLRPSRRAIMTLDRDGQTELALASVMGRDAGVYSCTASNEVGSASTSGKVEVIEGPMVEKRAPPALVGPDVPYSKEPMFIRKPRSSEAYEGDTVIIECEVTGDPKPDVYWLRDFLKPDYYRDASHFKRVGAGPEYRFEIPHAKLDYTGAYSVVARNVHGEAKAIISLQILVKDLSSTDDSHNVRYGRVDVIPRFERNLNDLLSHDGDAIEFECRVSGHPEPDIRWYHYAELIRDCSYLECTFDAGAARLKIKQVTADDEGTYTCEAGNNLGKASTSACLVVYPPGEPNTLSARLRRPALSAASTPRSTPRSTPARSLSRTTTPAPDMKRLSSPSRQMAPSFYTYPFNKVVEEGETVAFQCAVKGLPSPWATWDKDGVIVTPSSRITVREKEEIRMLEIEHVTTEDVGLYRICIENDYGRAEGTARLEVITQEGKFYAGVRAYSASPRRSAPYRKRCPSNSKD